LRLDFIVLRPAHYINNDNILNTRHFHCVILIYNETNLQNPQYLLVKTCFKWTC